MLLQRGDKLVMIGDSITDAGRAYPVGEAVFDGLGKGYVAFIDALLNAAYPDLGIRVVNMGISGNTVRDLAARWQKDVIDQNPEWVSIMIGTNDVWRQFDRPMIRESHVYIEEYEETLRRLVDAVKPSLKGLILMTPFFLEPRVDDAMRAKMDEYGRVVFKIAQEIGAVFVDTQAAFNRILEHLYPSAIASDRVHPNPTGHMVLARAFLTAIGYAW